MVVWGGYNSETGDPATVGGRYDPATNAWSVCSSQGAPFALPGHTAIWTGSRMIVWGGTARPPPTGLGRGARYDPVADVWAPMNDAEAPGARRLHAALWTGTRMLVWGGLA